MSKRSDMLVTEIRTVVAPALRYCPPECGIISITKIEVSSDGSYATAYVSALKEPKAALAFLEQQRNELQHQLGKMPRAKIPKLRFRLDEGPAHGSRIDELLSGEASKQSSQDS